MRRLQISLDDDLAEQLARQALAERTSKSALIRRYLRVCLADDLAVEADPLGAMIGCDDFEPEPINDVVYE